MFILVIIAFFTSVAIVSVAMPYIIRKTEQDGLLDIPNKRKVHTTPVSRFGGVAFVPAMFISIIVALSLDEVLGVSIAGGVDGVTNTWRFIVLFMSSTILYIIGVIDDMYGLGYKTKLLAQAFSSLFIIFGLVYPLFGFHLHLIIEFGIIIFIINSINLIDGIDGLASGISMIALFTLIACHMQLNNWFGAIVGAAMFGAVIVFFYFNTVSWKYKVFMGDTGSLTLGLVLSYLVEALFVFERRDTGHISYLTFLSISALIIPMLDVIRVVLVRLKNKKSPFLPDKNHIHHKLMAAGYSQTQTLRLILSACGICVILTWTILSFII